MTTTHSRTKKTARLHACPGGCGAPVPYYRFACRACWYTLPAELRRLISANYGRDLSAHSAAMSAARQWYQDNTPPRPAPPPLVYPNPECPLCDGETLLNDEHYECERCRASWAATRPFDDGEWADPAADRCRSTHRPWSADIRLQLRTTEYRCVLDAGHSGSHRHPEAFEAWTDEPSQVRKPTPGSTGTTGEERG